MLIDTPEARVPLAPGQLTRLDLAPRTRLRGVAGQTWVTLDHDQRDIVLGPGDEYVVETPARAIACALRADGRAELWVRG
jgi:hypothetical protein